jgi:hypothetical protein
MDGRSPRQVKTIGARLAARSRRVLARGHANGPVLVALALVALLCVYLLVALGADDLVYRSDETWPRYWLNWWVGQALRDGQPVSDTDLAFYPLGTWLPLHVWALVQEFGTLGANHWYVFRHFAEG